MRKWFYPLSFVTLIAFAILFLNLTNEKMIEFDANIADLLAGNQFLQVFRIFGEQIIIIIAALILILFLGFYKRNYRGMLVVLFSVGGGNLLNKLLKAWVQRERPDFPNQVDSFSFPSGNAMVGLLYLFTFAYFLTESVSSKITRYIIWLGAIVLTILVGLSRVAATAHYASDVLAGWMIGYSFFIIATIWYEWRNGQMNKRVTQSE